MGHEVMIKIKTRPAVSDISETQRKQRWLDRENRKERNKQEYVGKRECKKGERKIKTVKVSEEKRASEREREMDPPCAGMCLTSNWPLHKTNREVFVGSLPFPDFYSGNAPLSQAKDLCSCSESWRGITVETSGQLIGLLLMISYKQCDQWPILYW